jgi:hypothetical protein
MSAPQTVLSTIAWQARADAHRERVQRFTVPWRERRSRGAVHPADDFLFQYYHYSPAKLEAWHPDPHEGIVDSVEARVVFAAPVYSATERVLWRDPGARSAADQAALVETRQFLRATQERPAFFGCFGMHEWAMVYGGHEVRHAQVAPLRLPQAQIDALVESRPVVCSHFDAFRFFAPSAKSFNRVGLSWEARHEHEQPGCIHANMDLYRWAYSAMPWIGSDLLWDCFVLAMELRQLDMAAGPYDLRAMGVTPVCIETAEGREEYQRRQRALAEQARALRARLIDALA